MSAGEGRVTGSLVLTGPGARRLPVRLSGSGRSLQVELLGSAIPSIGTTVALARRVGVALEGHGMTVELVAGPFRVLELGRPGRPYRPHPLGVLYLVARAGARRVAELLRSPVPR